MFPKVSGFHRARVLRCACRSGGVFDSITPKNVDGLRRGPAADEGKVCAVDRQGGGGVVVRRLPCPARQEARPKSVGGSRGAHYRAPNAARAVPGLRPSGSFHDSLLLSGCHVGFARDVCVTLARRTRRPDRQKHQSQGQHGPQRCQEKHPRIGRSHVRGSFYQLIAGTWPGRARTTCVSRHYAQRALCDKYVNRTSCAFLASMADSAQHVHPCTECFPHRKCEISHHEFARSR